MLAAGAAGLATLLVLAGAGISTYHERPPFGDDIAYESGYVQGLRTRHRDLTGERVRDLLHGGCARLLRDGLAGEKAALAPDRWIAGCLDGAAGRPSGHQGLLGG